MQSSMRAVRLALFAVASLAAFGSGGCSMFGGGDDTPDTTAAVSPPQQQDGEIDVRRYIGPDYCPELRIVDGVQLVRRYESGHEDDPAFITWQASIGKTARECLYDPQGGLTLKIGISGRVIAGPKGGAGPVSVPLKIAVVKYQEAVLATQSYALDVTIPAQGSAVFSDVKEILVPSPGTKRDYVIYVGFDIGDWDPMHPVAEPVIAQAEEEAVSIPDEVIEEPPVEAPVQAAPAQPATPRELPVPADGFVLGQ